MQNELRVVLLKHTRHPEKVLSNHYHEWCI